MVKVKKVTKGYCLDFGFFDIIVDDLNNVLREIKDSGYKLNAKEINELKSEMRNLDY